MQQIIMSAITCLLAASAQLLGAVNEDVDELIQDHAQFAFSLYPTLDSEEKNLIFSPHGISNCLSMVYLGARANTESQMQKALHLQVDRKNIAKATYSLNQSLLSAKNDNSSYQLNIANAVWVDQGAFLLADFRYAIQEQIKAKLGKINFATPSIAISEINRYILDQTQGKITELVTSEDIDASTRLVLTNAVYFEGSWGTKFDPKSTQDWPFHANPDVSKPVKMMHQCFSTLYYENEMLQAVAMPFEGKSLGGGTLAFLLLLPKSSENFAAMFNELPNEFRNWLSALSTQRIDLKLPKFNFNVRLNLNNPLQQLGMEDAFESDANFAGIDGMRDLFLNKVIHQTFIALDENGVSAASATAASMNIKSSLEQKAPVQVIVDHPFLFFIVDLKSQEMLFMGKVVQPG